MNLNNSPHKSGHSVADLSLCGVLIREHEIVNLRNGGIDPCNVLLGMSDI